MTQKKQYQINDYLERREQDFYLAFFPKVGQYYALNESGSIILNMLKEYQDFDRIYTELSGKFNVDMLSFEAYIENFLSELQAKSLVDVAATTDRKVENEKKNFPVPDGKPLSIPFIMPLEEVYDKGEQCKLFCMPKRSCKSLPSGFDVEI